MTTPIEILNLAFRDAGIIGEGQTPSAEMMNDGLTRMNYMMSQWAVKRWLVYQLVDTAFGGTGALYYVVGPGGEFDIARQDKIEYAFFRQLNTTNPNKIDQPLEPLFAHEDYSRITLKQLASFPSYYFFDSGYPTGKLYVWPLPSNLYEIHILTKATLSRFNSLQQNIILPDEYMAALHYNMSKRLRVAYRFKSDPELNMLAKEALNVITAANAQIPRLSMPSGLPRPGVWNPYSGLVN